MAAVIVFRFFFRSALRKAVYPVWNAPWVGLHINCPLLPMCCIAKPDLFVKISFIWFIQLFFVKKNGIWQKKAFVWTYGFDSFCHCSTHGFRCHKLSLSESGTDLKWPWHGNLKFATACNTEGTRLVRQLLKFIGLMVLLIWIIGLHGKTNRRRDE